jgi:integrase
LPFVNAVSNGKGGRFHYFRSKETGHIRLKGQPGTAEFHGSYTTALALRERIRAGRADEDQSTFTWLANRFLGSAEFAALADDTQKDYLAIAGVLKAELGDQPWRFITRAMLKAVRDDYADTARKANKLAALTSRIYGWGNEADLVPDGLNPATGLKKLKRKGGAKEYVPWSNPELDWYCAAAPMHALTPVLLALYTGQRRKDCRLMTWQQDQGTIIRVRTAKTGELIDMPCHPALRAHLDLVRKSAKVVSLTGPICLSDKGTPWTTDNAMSGAVRRVIEAHPRIPNNRGLHGVRYAAAGRMEEGGATVAAIEAVLGHRTFRMAMKYASARLRAAQGIAAMKGSDNG